MDAKHQWKSGLTGFDNNEISMPQMNLRLLAPDHRGSRPEITGIIYVVFTCIYEAFQVHVHIHCIYICVRCFSQTKEQNRGLLVKVTCKIYTWFWPFICPRKSDLCHNDQILKTIEKLIRKSIHASIFCSCFVLCRVTWGMGTDSTKKHQNYTVWTCLYWFMSLVIMLWVYLFHRYSLNIGGGWTS